MPGNFGSFLARFPFCPYYTLSTLFAALLPLSPMTQSIGQLTFLATTRDSAQKERWEGLSANTASFHSILTSRVGWELPSSKETREQEKSSFMRCLRK